MHVKKINDYTSAYIFSTDAVTIIYSKEKAIFINLHNPNISYVRKMVEWKVFKE